MEYIERKNNMRYPPDFRIRKAEKKDLSKIIKLKSELFKFESHIDHLLSKEKKSRMFDNIYNKLSFFQKDFVFMIAETSKGEIIGFVSGWIEKTPPIFKIRKIGIVGDLYIKSVHRSAGVGTELSNEMIGWFKSKKISWIKVMVYAGNKPSISFWKHQGFEDYINEYRLILE